MKQAAFNPRRLDVVAFARAGAVLGGAVPLLDMARLREGLLEPELEDHASEVHWQAQGDWRQPAGGVPQVRLHLHASAEVRMTCQRCLQPLGVTLKVDRSLRFVDTEEIAARLDEGGEEDVLSVSQALDLQVLVEDELIMSLPLVPRHDECQPPQASGVPAYEAGSPGGGLAAPGPKPDQAISEGGRHRPFEVLAHWPGASPGAGQAPKRQGKRGNR